MATTPLGVSNEALGLIGANRISDFDNDTTKEAILCRDFYTPSLEYLLQEGWWSFAAGRDELDTPDAVAPAFEFENRFPVPSDFIEVRQLSIDGSFTDDFAWELEAGFILSDADELYLKYTKNQTTLTTWSPMARQALAALLAINLALPVTGSREHLEAMANLYGIRLNTALNRDGLQSKSVDFLTAKIIQVR